MLVRHRFNLFRKMRRRQMRRRWRLARLRLTMLILFKALRINNRKHLLATMRSFGSQTLPHPQPGLGTTGLASLGLECSCG